MGIENIVTGKDKLWTFSSQNKDLFPFELIFILQLNMFFLIYSLLSLTHNYK